ncbi:MAG: hypothetical protein QM703_22745 [Gemmatales bacterium]
MAVTLQATTNVEIIGTMTNQIDLEKYSSSFNLGGDARTYTSSSVSKEFSDTRALTTTESLDLTALTNAGINTSQNFGTLRVIFIENLTGSATLTFGGGTTPAFPVAVTIPASGRILIEGSWTIDGTHKLMNMTASGVLSYNIFLMGN